MQLFSTPETQSRSQDSYTLPCGLPQAQKPNGNKVFLQFGSKTKGESWELGFPQVTVRRSYQESLTYHALPHMSNFIKRTL